MNVPTAEETTIITSTDATIAATIASMWVARPTAAPLRQAVDLFGLGLLALHQVIGAQAEV